MGDRAAGFADSMQQRHWRRAGDPRQHRVRLAGGQGAEDGFQVVRDHSVVAEQFAQAERDGADFAQAVAVRNGDRAASGAWLSAGGVLAVTGVAQILAACLTCADACLAPALVAALDDDVARAAQGLVSLCSGDDALSLPQPLHSWGRWEHSRHRGESVFAR